MSSIRLVAQTREIPPVDDLLSHTSAAQPLAWLRRSEGIVAAGDGIVASVRIPAAWTASAARSSADTWREIAATAEIDDPLGLPGTGLVAFGALAFDEDSSADSILVVPDTVIGRRDGRSWITRIRTADHEFAPVPDAVAYAPHLGRPGRTRCADPAGVSGCRAPGPRRDRGRRLQQGRAGPRPRRDRSR